MDRLNSIVVGVDFSLPSATALKQGIRMAQQHQAGLHVVHVIDTLVVMDLEKAMDPYQQSIADALVRDARKAWESFRVAIPGADKAGFEVEIDNRLAAIVRQVTKHSADLLILGTHGEFEPDCGTGPLATSCVRSAPCEVLLVRGPHVGPFTTIVVGVDFSETSRRALAAAARVAARDGAKLHVLHVFRPPWNALRFRSDASTIAPAEQEKYRDQLRAQLEQFCQPLSQQMGDLKPIIEVVEHRRYGTGISEFATSFGADLVVVGNRGRSNLRYVLLGSTAERVVRQTPCSILAVKPEGFEQP
jgi:nucleotide-binding universal stress UspA family protein